MSTSVITFSDAAMIERLERVRRPGESLNLVAKRLLQEKLTELEANPTDPDDLDAIAEQLRRTLSVLDDYRSVRP